MQGPPLLEPGPMCETITSTGSRKRKMNGVAGNAWAEEEEEEERERKKKKEEMEANEQKNKKHFQGKKRKKWTEK